MFVRTINKKRGLGFERELVRYILRLGENEENRQIV